MADNTTYLPPQSLDLQQILEEAKHRWLRPNEILQILGNHRIFKLTPDPPVRPSAGSLFLFDRKTLRYFRKDGYRWRKKKDGKTVREAHEKLKSGSVDVLHCYYAHGEDNQNFQRRCYWMLDGKLEHIVLVHYRDVKEGGRSGMPQLLPDLSSQLDSPQPGSASPLVQAATLAFVAQRLFASSPDRISHNCHSLPSQFGDVDSRHNLGADSLSGAVHGSVSQGASLLGNEVEEFSVSARNPCELQCVGCKSFRSAGSSLCPETPSSSTSANLVHGLKLCAGRINGGDFAAHKSTDSSLDDGGLDSVIVRGRLISDVDDQTLTAVPKILMQEHDVNLIRPRFLSCSDGQNADLFSQPYHGGENDKNSGELKKLDSFGRWVDKEIGGDCDDSLMASDSGNYWNTLGTENDDKEVSNLSHHMQLDIESLGPSISQDQLFSIHDFSPDWAYSGVETKVIIVGAFLGSKKFSTEHKWGCMFGEIEVSAEVLTDNVIRCQAPLHASGRVPFYITSQNRLACSEVREFKYRETPSDSVSLYARSMQREDLRLQVRLAKLLCLGRERKWLNCCTEGCDKCKLSSTLHLMRNSSKKDSATIRENCIAYAVNPNNSRDGMIPSLLHDKLCQWLVCKVHEGGKGPDVLDDEGQGVIHLAASLGYEWAMGLIISASNNPNFRDAQGRTALHWASYFGREETVIALVRLGADPSAVNDPTRTFPGGRTAADIASSQGHKGISGYLAEAFLTKHLSSLNIKENATDSVDATILADQATKIAASLVTLPSNGKVDEHLSLRGSLAAVRKSALAASLIQATYRSFSFRYRKLSGRNDDSGVALDLAALGFLNKDKRSSCFEDYLHSAAIKIQRKYRGWKGRKKFIKIRNRMVKVQAHVRGCQVRNQYKKFIWSVSIVEKAILRWRRKGCGLRGFRVEKTIGDSMMGTDKTDEYEFLRISCNQKFAGVEKALARVQSMVRDPVARDQYMRLVVDSEKFEHGSEDI